MREKATIKERIKAYQRVFKAVNEVESMAFYDGHYLAFGFAAGSCRHTFCSQKENCSALQGKKCRIALRSRPSMEAVGFDVYKMAASAGWDIYPIGSDAKTEDIPKGTFMFPLFTELVVLFNASYAETTLLPVLMAAIIEPSLGTI